MSQSISHDMVRKPTLSHCSDNKVNIHIKAPRAVCFKMNKHAGHFRANKHATIWFGTNRDNTSKSRG